MSLLKVQLSAKRFNTRNQPRRQQFCQIILMF
jgi:hypothetical protein